MGFSKKQMLGQGIDLLGEALLVDDYLPKDLERRARKTSGRPKARRARVEDTDSSEQENDEDDGYEASSDGETVEIPISRSGTVRLKVGRGQVVETKGQSSRRPSKSYARRSHSSPPKTSNSHKRRGSDAGFFKTINRKASHGAKKTLEKKTPSIMESIRKRAASTVSRGRSTTRESAPSQDDQYDPDSESTMRGRSPTPLKRRSRAKNQEPKRDKSERRMASGESQAQSTRRPSISRAPSGASLSGGPPMPQPPAPVYYYPHPGAAVQPQGGYMPQAQQFMPPQQFAQPQQQFTPQQPQFQQPQFVYTAMPQPAPTAPQPQVFAQQVPQPQQGPGPATPGPMPDQTKQPTTNTTQGIQTSSKESPPAKEADPAQPLKERFSSRIEAFRGAFGKGEDEIELNEMLKKFNVLADLVSAQVDKENGGKAFGRLVREVPSKTRAPCQQGRAGGDTEEG